MTEAGVAEVTNERMYGLLTRMQRDLSETRQDVRETKHEPNVVRTHLVAIQSDTNNIYGMLGRHDDRLDRIERGLELRELAESQHRFDLHA